MRVSSILFDSRINAKNVLIEMTLTEYEELVRDVVNNNEFQRKRVHSSKTVYALLREDLKRQCVIPPIVLALTRDIDGHGNAENELIERITENKESLLILDGLQRTHTVLDLLSELRQKKDEQTLQLMLSSKIRVEIYVGLNRLGILYRMLTLNTGQTPMSLRQQIEMLYLDYLSREINGVELIRESDEAYATRPEQYNFRDVVEGFNSYLDRDELPIDKANILENINSLEKLSKENQNSELFERFVLSVHKVIERFANECNGVEVSADYIEEKGVPFGKNALQIFKKPQALSGFGAAVGRLIDFNIINTLDDVEGMAGGIHVNNPVEFLEAINDALLWLKNNSKKIGNAQRSFFSYFFRELLNRDGDAFNDPLLASSSALRKYQAQNM